MKKSKENVLLFLVWIRNGTAFCTTWFLILLLIYSYFFNYQTISTKNLSKMLLLIIGGVIIFSLLFTRVFIKKWSFIPRLTCFMISISLYECIGFYWLGLLDGRETIFQLLVFVGILLSLYFACIAVYHRYSKRQGRLYTEALQTYQKQRSVSNEE